ncbi:MAG: alcohol dehydrogenase catalytic domain-containing protein [Planctomycetota bacterium]|nr:MAG: alcohol dehydrogenase catalytic domain-containing protein [Planctomycetota bacterium]
MKAQSKVNLPQTQHAVQLVGPDELVLNKSKEVFPPGPHQVLCKVEAVGLCFSDLKLLKQFSSHARKTEIVSGIDPGILKEIPSYAPADIPTVPGHEAVVRIAEVGPGVESFKPGQRYLVETDYRWLPTTGSNASFGYNFEGALQQYVLMDERVITSPEGDSMLIPVSEGLSASAIALVEPWACVEDAYATKERRRLKQDGRMLVVAETDVADDVFAKLFNLYDRPGQITWVSKFAAPPLPDIAITTAADISKIAGAAYDDVIYFGSDANTAEALFEKVAPQGLVNIVLCGGEFASDVVTPIGRVHYGGVRIVGTTGPDPAESMACIPETGEVRAGDKINVVGAGGPMGTMHVIRNICQGVGGVSVFAADIDEDRLAVLSKLAEPLAKKNNISYEPYNPKTQKIEESFDYTVVMAPIPELVSTSVKTAEKGAVINIFAGIPADVTTKIDLDACIEKQLYFIGTSGSVLEDMKRVLAKVESGRLDTDVSVAAVCGLDGAGDGIRAVEKRQIAGKIMVYPACKGLGLTELSKLKEKIPEIAECLNEGMWNKKAEEVLLKAYQNS